MAMLNNRLERLEAIAKQEKKMTVEQIETRLMQLLGYLPSEDEIVLLRQELCQRDGDQKASG